MKWLIIYDFSSELQNQYFETGKLYILSILLFFHKSKLLLCLNVSKCVSNKCSFFPITLSEIFLKNGFSGAVNTSSHCFDNTGSTKYFAYNSSSPSTFFMYSISSSKFE